MLRALGIVTDNIDSGRMIGTAAGLCGGSAGSAWRGKKEEMKHEEEKSNGK